MIKDLCLIACISQDYGIGITGDLIWHIPEDMRFFRETTQGNTVVMGRKTYESIGNKPLPKRENVVLSRQDVTGAKACHNEAELRQYLQNIHSRIFIIGGSSLYQMFINDAKKIYLTEVDAVQPADTFFPEFNKSMFTRKVLQDGLRDGIKYEIVEYTRK